MSTLVEGGTPFFFLHFLAFQLIVGQTTLVLSPSFEIKISHTRDFHRLVLCNVRQVAQCVLGRSFLHRRTDFFFMLRLKPGVSILHSPINSIALNMSIWSWGRIFKTNKQTNKQTKKNSCKTPPQMIALMCLLALNSV